MLRWLGFSMMVLLVSTTGAGCPEAGGITGSAVDELGLSPDGLWIRTTVYMDDDLNGVSHDLVLTNVDDYCDRYFDVMLAEEAGELPFAHLVDEAGALFDAGDPGGACEKMREYYEAYAALVDPAWHDGAAYLSFNITDGVHGVSSPPAEGTHPACCEGDERPAFFGSLLVHTGNYWARLAAALDCEAAAAGGDTWGGQQIFLDALESEVDEGAMTLATDGDDAWTFQLEGLSLVESGELGGYAGTVEGEGTFSACDIEVYYEYQPG